MLRAAAFGMLIYGVHDFIVGATDLIGVGMLEWWANLWRILSGGVLTLAAALVRVSLPGGLALAVSGLLALQSINLHNDPHVYGQLLLLPQVARALFGAALILLAHLGWGSGTGPEHDQSNIRG